MNRFMLTAAALSLLFISALVSANAEPQSNAPSDMKITDEQCVTLWKQAAAGVAEDTESIPAQAGTAYIKDMAKVDADKDGKLSTKEWANACKSGLIMSTPAVPAEAPKP